MKTFLCISTANRAAWFGLNARHPRLLFSFQLVHSSDISVAMLLLWALGRHAVNMQGLQLNPHSGTEVRTPSHNDQGTEFHEKWTLRDHNSDIFNWNGWQKDRQTYTRSSFVRIWWQNSNKSFGWLVRYRSLYLTRHEVESLWQISLFSRMLGDYFYFC